MSSVTSAVHLGSMIFAIAFAVHLQPKTYTMNYLPRLWMVCAMLLLVTVLSVYQCASRKDVTTVKAPSSREHEFSLPVLPPEEGIALVEAWMESANAEAFRQRSRLLHESPEEGWRELRAFFEKQGKVRRCKWLGMDQTLAVPVEKVMVIFESGQYRLAFLVFEEGVWKVDAESFLAYHSQPWSKISGQGDCESIIRVLIDPDSYYNGEFVDEETWKCVKMLQPDHDAILYGYVRRGSPEAIALAEITQAKSNAPVTLQIARKESMRINQYQIQKVMASGWLEARSSLAASGR